MQALEDDVQVEQDIQESQEIDSAEEQEAEESQESTEETTDQPEQEEKVTLDDRQQEILNKAINRQVGKRKEIEEQLAKAQQELEELRQKVPKNQRPEVPNLPDMSDPEFEAKLEARDEAIRKQQEWDYNERQRSEAELQQQQAVQKQQQEAALQTLQSFGKNAEDLGISTNQIKENFQTLANLGVDNSVTAYILEDPIGPQIADYLAKNPNELDGLKNLSAQRVAVKIATEITPKAKESQKRIDTPPAPPETLRGGAGGDYDDGLAGVEYS